MKNLLFCFSILVSGMGLSQTWQTINTFADLGIHAPHYGFKLNRYTNDLWFLAGYQVACLHPNGSVDTLEIDALTTAGDNAEPDIEFTPERPYLLNAFSGLYKVNTDYSIDLVYPGYYLSETIYANGDTIYYPLEDPQGYLKYFNSSTETAMINFDRIAGKGDQIYGAFNTTGSLQKYTGNTSDGYESYSQIDDQYICGQFNDLKFSPYSDTFYVACAAGVSKAINLDFIDSIVPENTVNMPSSNVLEIEFDDQDRIWACFGDVNDVPFALARLDGDTWTNYSDNTNSPIDFSKYLGFEVDTMGNVWVMEYVRMHTLLNPNSPVWLGTTELSNSSLNVYPIPASEMVIIDLPSGTGQLTVTSMTGEILYAETGNQSQFTLDVSNWSKGCYIISWTDGARFVRSKIIK